MDKNANKVYLVWIYSCWGLYLCPQLTLITLPDPWEKRKGSPCWTGEQQDMCRKEITSLWTHWGHTDIFLLAHLFMPFLRVCFLKSSSWFDSTEFLWGSVTRTLHFFSVTNMKVQVLVSWYTVYPGWRSHPAQMVLWFPRIRSLLAVPDWPNSSPS